MTEYPFDLSGYVKGGRVVVAPAGADPEAILTEGQWTDISQAVSIDGIDHDGPLHTTTISKTSFSTSITLHPLPRTRREQRAHNAFMRMIWGGPLPQPRKRRQLIHNGRKP